MGALEGRVAIITGAGRGLGREHALLFASEGASVVVNDLGAAGDGSGSDIGPADEVVREIKAAGGRAVANTTSITSFDDTRSMVDQAVEEFGDLHVIVNNAGILRDRMLVSMAEDEFDAVIAVHLKGAFNLTRHAASYWRDRAKSGAEVDRAIVNTSSGAGLHGNPGQTNYAAAKAGIAAMTIVNSIELRRYHVRANCIAPVASTRLTRATPGMEDLMEKEQFDTGLVSPLVAALAMPTCRFNGQVFSVFAGDVGIYQGWSIHEEVATTGLGVEELACRLADLPAKVKVNSQMAKFLEVGK